MGGLIIGVYGVLEPLVDWVQSRTRLGTYSRLEWTTNQTLQLQRLAHEELGLGTWTRVADDCPITLPGELLASIDISDPKHPRLKCPSGHVEEAGSSQEVAWGEEGKL